MSYFAAKDQIRHANFVFHYRPSKLLAPAKIQWSKPEYADEQEPPWGTSTKPPEPFDTPKQSTCKLQYTHTTCAMLCVWFVYFAIWYWCYEKETRSFMEEINHSVWNSPNTVRCHIKMATFVVKRTKHFDKKLLGIICFKLLELLHI